MMSSTDKLLQQFKVLADPVRVRLVALCRVADCSVSELTHVTRQSQPRVSQHLKQLCGADLLERFRDGHFVYYRVPHGAMDTLSGRRLMELLPADEPQFEKDIAALRILRADDEGAGLPPSDGDRSLHRALLELTVSRPVGDLIDIGCGQGRILKLLAARAQHAVGVDIDSDTRRLARAKLLLAGTPNTTLRAGDMAALPFDNGMFDTVILDDVLHDNSDVDGALQEAKRILADGGQILLLKSVTPTTTEAAKSDYRRWAIASGLRLAPPRAIPAREPAWLLSVATPVDTSAAAA